MIFNTSTIAKITKTVLEYLAKAKSAMEKLINLYDAAASGVEKLKDVIATLDDVIDRLSGDDTEEEE